ncbi:MAG: serine/threonine-protein kinase [Propionibacteriaceae bacterium]
MEAVGRYRIVRQLGAGAFATVWLGHDDDLDVPVAIKVLAENWTQNADVRRRFVDEARVLRRIQDPRVVVVHDIGSLDDGRPYFVMNYADAGTVAELVAAPADRSTALATAVEVGRAVQVLHDHDVLHRDVKPSNLLRHRRRDGTEQLMIADLGTAKALAESSGLTLSAGTPAYMAPEQAHGQRALDVRADVYGIAAVAYALISGRPPFPDVSAVSDVAFRNPARHPDPVDTEGSALDDVLRSALAFDPDERPATATQLAEQFGRLRRGDQDATRLEHRPGERAAVTTRPDRAVAKLVGLAVVVMILAAVLTWLILGLFG